MNMMYWADGSWGWGGWLVMVTLMIAFWGLLAWVAVALLRAAKDRPNQQDSSGNRSPEAVLADRFARGEIEEDDYRQRSDVLRKERASAS
jgi:putative membrane protein